MRLIELPQGNGQEVYIDPDWINGDDEQDFFHIVQDDVETTVKRVRRSVIEYLYNSGYQITSDSTSVSNDAFFFTPCLDRHLNNTKEEYNGKKKKKITECFDGELVKAPLTISFPKSSFPTELPPLPFVLKNEQEMGGKEKFLIETPEQLELFQRFYNEINAYDRNRREESLKREWSFFKDLKFDEKGRSKYGLCVNLIDYKKELYEAFVLQKFVKTPTRYNTSLRVVTSSSGDILCASLKYSDSSTGKMRTSKGLFNIYLSDPSSPYFLGSKSIISNTVAGGNSILLGGNNYTELEQEILSAHGIDPNNAVVPQEVVSVAIKIAIICKREIGAISGMDFIYDEEEKLWKYLEQHEYPMLNTYTEAYGLPYNTSNNKIDFYETHRSADIDARLRSLVLTMQRKYAMKVLTEQSEKTFS